SRTREASCRPRPAPSAGPCLALPKTTPPAAGPGRLERLQGRLLVLLDVEELVQLGDLEDLVDLGIDVGQDQPAAGRLEFLVQGDELAQGGAGEVLDVAEVEQELAAAFLVHQAEELIADDLDVLLVQDLAVDEVDHGDIADVLNLQAATARLRRHKFKPSHREEPASCGDQEIERGSREKKPIP